MGWHVKKNPSISFNAFYIFHLKYYSLYLSLSFILYLFIKHAFFLYIHLHPPGGLCRRPLTGCCHCILIFWYQRALRLCNTSLLWLFLLFETWGAHSRKWREDQEFFSTITHKSRFENVPQPNFEKNSYYIRPGWRAKITIFISFFLSFNIYPSLFSFCIYFSFSSFPLSFSHLLPLSILSFFFVLS